MTTDANGRFILPCWLRRESPINSNKPRLTPKNEVSRARSANTPMMLPRFDW
ncbi:Uncharacterised protein [Vibrio cholerae]|nr:Uncharacterised protein [Vibrio cholerae]